MKGLIALCAALLLIGCTHPTILTKTRTVHYDADGMVTGYTETETLHQQSNRAFVTEDSDFHDSDVSDEEDEVWPPHKD